MHVPLYYVGKDCCAIKRTVILRNEVTKNLYFRSFVEEF